MALTADDIKRFEQPLALEDHEARASGKNKDETKQQWLIYVTQEGIIPLLNSIDPNWTWDVRESSKWDKYAVVTGRLTIKDVFRDGRGGNSPNSKSASTDENTEKGAETDALKRAAVKFGIGLYLRSQPTIWVDITPNKPWEDEKTALAKFADWYKREFGAQNARNGQPPPQRPPNAPVPPVGGQNANPPNGLAPSTPATPPSADASAKAELFPDDSPVKHYTCTEIRVVKFGTGKQAQLKRADGGDPIVLLGSEKLRAAGYPDETVDHWIKTLDTWFPLKPSADVEAALTDEKWVVGDVRQLEAVTS